MLEKFSSYIKEKELCAFGDRILLAVSGGIDSVVMAHLFSESGFQCAVAHCNFRLRGTDSEADEAFVRSMAEALGMPCHVKIFDVDKEMAEKGKSIQMAARDLRYDWFRELIEESGFDLLATAHNLNDSVETFFLNLSRGTGIRGLTGIPPRNDFIIRPLLGCTRKEISDYAGRMGIQFREDSSNQETKYRRNKVRHDMIPVMEQINPGFIETMGMNMERLGETRQIFSNYMKQVQKELFVEDSGTIRIHIRELRKLEPLRTWLYELFSPFGFTRNQCEGIEKIMESEPGRRSVSTSHQVFKDRESLLLVRSQPGKFERYYLDSPENISSLPFPMDIRVMERDALGSIPGDPSLACLDYDRIQFPLTIRHWQHGDFFYPLGMEQMKKLSDFFVDQKMAVPMKETTWILASGKKIVWIMGLRIDHRFRIREDTRKVLMLRFQSDIAAQHTEEFT
jgi:tRNA(Ile)-lysidine synthase